MLDLLFISLLAFALWNYFRKRHYKRELRIAGNRLAAMTQNYEEQRKQSRFYFRLWRKQTTGKDSLDDEDDGVLDLEVIEEKEFYE